MGARGKRRSQKQSPLKEEAPKPSSASPEEEPSAAQTPTNVLLGMVNTFLVGVVIATAAVGARLFWPSLTTNVILVTIGPAIVGGYLFFKRVWGKHLDAFYQLVMPRRSITVFVVLLLAAELTAGNVISRARRRTVVRIVPGPTLYNELEFQGQKLVLTVGDTAFPVTDPKRTIFYFGSSEDHIEGAIEKDEKSNPGTLETILWNDFKFDPSKEKDRKHVEETLEQWQKTSRKLTGRFNKKIAGQLPSGTFLDPLTEPTPVPLVITRVGSGVEGVETYVANLPKKPTTK